MIGRTLSHFKITTKLGEGGMGKVYRAEDSKLGREVAIKVLPETVSAEPERLARFDREARVLASLNHPSIAAIYSFEHEDSVHFLVMELAEGEDLAERIERGPVPLDQALRIALQIAEALEAAHERGIIHRDLKPANVRVSAEGQVKVLDFGLAKAFEPGDGTGADAEDPSNSPTLPARMTRVGTLLGTAAYMSPEQARSQEADKRADIWSFGVVLYEMLEGKPLFAGASVTDVLAAVVRDNLDLPELPEGVPPSIRELLARCLDRDPKNRLRDIGEARVRIARVLESPEKTGADIAGQSPPVVSGRGSSRPYVWGALLLLLAAIVVGAITWPWTGRPEILQEEASSQAVEVSRWEVSLGTDQELLVRGRSHPLALSPDGKKLAYMATNGGGSLLYVRAVDEFVATRLQGTQGARNPFFSPDGKWVGFFAEGELRRIPTGGGAVQVICKAPLDNLGSAWREDGTIVFASYATGLWKVQVDDGTPRELTRIDSDAGETQHRWPQFLPRNRVLMTVGTIRGSQVAVVDLADGKKSFISGVADVSVARYLPTGHLLFAQESVLQVVPFDVNDSAVRGAPVTVVEGVTALSTQGVSYFAVSDSGTLIYLSGSGQAGNQLVWVDFNGNVTPIGGQGSSYLQPRLSPDGEEVAATIGEELGVRVVGTLDLKRGSQRRLTFESTNAQPVWSPDGRHIVFSSSRDGGWNLYWRAADGSGTATRLLASDNELWASDFSPDGKLLIYWEIDSETARDLWVLRLEGDSTPAPFLVTPYNERAAVFSPDGRWMAYVSDESGGDEVYVRPYPGPGGQITVSTEGGVEPHWAHDGRRLFYRQGDRMMAVSIENDPHFSVSKPTVLFEGRFDRGVTGNLSYDLDPRGDRFLMIQPLGDRTTSSFRVVLNWFEDVRRLSPVESPSLADGTS